MPVLDRSALEDVAGMNFLAAALGVPHPGTSPSREAPGRFVDQRRSGAAVLRRRGRVRPEPVSCGVPTGSSFTALRGAMP